MRAKKPSPRRQGLAPGAGHDPGARETGVPERGPQLCVCKYIYIYIYTYIHTYMFIDLLI